MKQGAFAWYDLAAPDVLAAVTFYTQVLGWTAEPVVMGGMGFTTFRAGTRQIAAVRAMADLPEGALPGWRGYIGVEDVAATVEGAVAAGAALRHGPVGAAGQQFAVLDDPQGARFAVCEWPAEEAAPMGEPGHVGWRELAARDQDAAFDFYAGLFGWTRDQAMPMGEMGVYQLVAVDGGEAMGAIMNAPPGAPLGWSYYFNTPDLDAAMARVTEAGGHILHGPHQVPGDVWIAVCLDPQDAAFSLVGPRR